MNNKITSPEQQCHRELNNVTASVTRDPKCAKIRKYWPREELSSSPAPFPDLPSRSRPFHHIPSSSFPSSPLRSLLRPLRQHSHPSLPFPASPFLSVILRFSPYPISIRSSPFLSAPRFCPPFSVSIRTPFLSLRSPFLPSGQLDKRFIEYYY